MRPIESEIGAIEVVDSHTEGEPTRVVIGGWPQPPGSTMAERREVLHRDFDGLRTGVVLEPRGHDAIVGALLTPPVSAGAAAGVIFFNDVGYLGMCGHGLIGVVRTLEHLGRATPGHIRIDTPVGTVAADLAADGTVSLENVPAFVHRAGVAVTVPELGVVEGDVAWGGNWFFLTERPAAAPELVLSETRELTRLTMAIRDALAAAGITGTDGVRVDHIELFGPPRRADADSRNFVLCPGVAYDRSPCGTGTSAKMAALHTHGRLPAGQRWRQESITGSLFTGWVDERDGAIIPHIQGRAFITAHATLRFDARDPFRLGIVGA